MHLYIMKNDLNILATDNHQEYTHIELHKMKF